MPTPVPADSTRSDGPGNPFSARAVLALVLLGTAVFVALLWMIGAGMTGGSTNDGGGHVGGKGLNGYAALADLLERRGYRVSRVRSPGRLDDPGLLVLTPPVSADAGKIEEIIARRRTAGPTLLILPKWLTIPVPATMQSDKARKGWVVIGDAVKPAWANGVASIEGLEPSIGTGNRNGAQWRGLGREGRLPDPGRVQSMSAGRIIPLVSGADEKTLAGYADDAGSYPLLDAAAGVSPASDRTDDDSLYPLVIVAEPDLLDNYGFADRERAMLALALIDLTLGGQRLPISFDLTLNGYARSANLLTLAFTPPFLAATLCLLIAAIAVGWRAFLRFGPPRQTGRAIAFGKRQLVANTAGLIRRTGRLHLVTGPYVDRSRERMVRLLALARHADAESTEAAIDRSLAARAGAPKSFSEAAARLRAARRPQDIVRAAQNLHALEGIVKA